MRLIDRNRRVQRVVCAALFHPRSVAPLILIYIVDDGGGFGPSLEVERIRISLLNYEVEPAPLDLELVQSLFSEPGNKNLPDARSGMKPHRVPATVPVIEIADDAYSLCVGRPH